MVASSLHQRAYEALPHRHHADALRLEADVADGARMRVVYRVERRVVTT